MSENLTYWRAQLNAPYLTLGDTLALHEWLTARGGAQALEQALTDAEARSATAVGVAREWWKSRLSVIPANVPKRPWWAFWRPA